MIFTKYLYAILISYHVNAFNLMQDEISGWREDLFTARKSSINLLGVISMSKVALLYSLINVFDPFIFLFFLYK